MSAPALRFKDGFGRDFPDWKHSTLGRVATITSGGTPSRANSDYWNGNIPWVTTSLIDFNIINEANEYITELGLKNSSAKIFPKNTLLMAMYGQGKTRGKVAVLGTKATTNQACAAIMLNETVNTGFVFQNLAGRYDEIRELSNAGGQENLSAGLIKEITLSHPSLPEQTKIANFLTAVDEKLAQLTRKHDLLTQYKKGVMQQIFSQELRFKDDDGLVFPEWEEENLLQLSESGFSNGVFNDPTKVGKGYKLINVLDMYINSTINETKLTLVELSDAEFNRNKVECGDIFFTRSSLVKSGIAYSNIYIGHSQDITFDGHLIRMRPRKDKLCPIFASYLLRTPSVRKQLVARGKTATMTTIGQADIAAVTVSFPALAEQTKIANFLTAIDEKISATKAQLEAVKQYKQGLLQQMFV